MDDQGRLVGIVTSRDIKFLTDYNVKIADVMTTNVVKAADGTSMQAAFEMMRNEKVGKLPMVDANGKLTGLYSFHDVKTLISKEEAQESRLKEMVEETFEGSIPAFIAAFSRSKKLTKQEVQQLQALIDCYGED